MRTSGWSLLAALAACSSHPTPPPNAPPPAPASAPDASAPAPDVSPTDAPADASAADVADASTGAGPWRYALSDDHAMSHVEVTLVLFDDRRPAGALRIGRFLNGCAAATYARLVGVGPGPDVLLGFGCVAPPGLAPGAAPVAARVIRRGDALVAQTGTSRRGHVARWEDGATLALPTAVTPTEAPQGMFTEAEVADAADRVNAR